MDLNLKDKVVVISGAAGKEGSIGETILQRLAEEGAIPAVIDRNARGFGYVEKIQEKGIDAIFCQTDVTDPVQIENAVSTIVKKYGRIDVVINNVGVNDGVGLDATYEEFMDSLKLNMVSYFLIVKHALPSLIASKGNILNIGSKVALTGQGRTSGYAASKGGVLGLTREWAVDLIKHDIRSNAIIIAESWTPSYDTWIRTLPNGEEKLQSIVKKIPLENRMTSTNEIADTCLFTISNRSSHTTGQFIFVDGGYVHLDRSLLTED
ncbi:MULTISPECIES: SDR family oxidoreductase [Zobellia]|uniref:SDR family oxidoreductase n=1 Tax=Zobellia TaxID=112040 RepID=UPI001BFF560E|nr:MULTISPECIES: SDR family oxidoreductase [Zobellia]MBT9188622.1 SDR family oxidoreductase [Zobellia russellii]MBU2976171.1 SDR family oxidoreductase [Zobellia sp. B3R18]MDO6819162.1 SDR family oxidoreductase [Zobellia sp. 1_MG-2023]